MAHMKVYYTTLSCPKCKTQLLKVQTGTTVIGSPLITCKTCGMTYRTNLRTEWFRYPQKWLVFLMPLIIAATMLVVGTIMEDLALGLICGIFGLIVGFCITLPNLIRILKSKQRMKDPAYLQQLLQWQVISREEFLALYRSIQ